MTRLRLLNFDKEIDINIDERIDLSNAFIAATYRQLVIASQCILTIYDLSSILLGEKFNNLYDVITIPKPILALTSTIDRIIYVYQSIENVEELKICCLYFQEQNLIIKSLNINEKIHLCSLDDGTIFIGYDSKIFSLTNNQWSFDTKIKKLSSGKEHILVLLSDGRLFTWGNGLHGALGLGDLEPCIQPTFIEVLSNDVHDIAAGGWHSLALLSDGSVMSWGWNNDGALGLDSTDDKDDISGVFCDPTLVTCLPLGVDCRQISAGARHSAFIGANDHVWLCGSNKHGQLGNLSSFSIEKGTSIYCLSWFTLLISY
jgi:hypothetical protein